MSTDEPTVLRSCADGIAAIVLHNPTAGNAITRGIYEALCDAWRWVESDPEVRVIIFTAAGERHFCLGGDLKSLSEQGTLRRPGERWTLTWRQAGVTKPVIVAVNGTVAGGGLGFVTDGDIVVASRNAKFLDTHVAVGQICGYGALRLVRLIGASEAVRIALAGGKLTAERAFTLGLVNELFDDPADAVAAARALAGRVVAASPTAVQRTFELQRAMESAPDEADVLTRADKAVEGHMAHPDASEGPAAWLEKRTPRWMP